MRNEKLIWQLFPTHVLILFSAILAVAWFGSQSLREFYIDQMVNNLKSRTRLIEPLVTDLLINGDIDELTQICLEAGIKASTRITVVDLKGEVVCDSEHDPIKMGNHANRPEIIQALAKDFGTSIRYSATLQTDMIYVAIPIDGPAARIGVLRMSFPVFSIDKKLREIYWQIIIATVFVVIIAAAITLLVSKKITQPLVEMKLGAERFAAGEFSKKLAVSGSEEIVSLAQAMNTMAAQLDDRIQAVLDQRNELETMFASMVEGVITVDAEERIINLNEAAAEMLRVEPAHSERKNILEVVRNIELLRFIQRVLSGIEPVERSIVLNRGKQDERVLQVHGARLSGGIKSKAGALIVINDVTHLLKLENVRRDFVANVSHELKTPITSIKGYVETLLDDNFQDVEQVRSFLKIISKQSNRLHAIVEDLLALSRIEQEYEKKSIDLQQSPINIVLKNGIEACAASASEKDIAINMQCPDELQATINGPLIEQAIINLVDNAVKYSKPNSSVTVKAELTDNLVISVIDSGIGIEEEHLPRLFERFYLVDKARSRKMGGTGLGLAIVKHIAMAHGGQVDVKSTPGKGSSFSIVLPA